MAPQPPSVASGQRHAAVDARRRRRPPASPRPPTLCVAQGGGFSPKRLRAMLLGVDKRRKGHDDDYGGAVPKAAVRSDAEAARGGGGAVCEEYKDVDVVSTVFESSSSLETGSGHLSMGSRVRVPEEDSCDSESVASNFEFHKEREPSARSVAAAAVVPPFSKPAPSNWDDAQKWIASPTANRPSRAAGGAMPRKMDKPSSGIDRLPATKIVLEATQEIDTKRIDPRQDKREIGCQKAVDWAPPDPYPEAEPCSKTAIAAESTIADSAEIKIQAWEDHQKAKIEAEMRKIEVEVERMRARAQDKLMSDDSACIRKAQCRREACYGGVEKEPRGCKDS